MWMKKRKSNECESGALFVCARVYVRAIFKGAFSGWGDQLN